MCQRFDFAPPAKLLLKRTIARRCKNYKSHPPQSPLNFPLKAVMILSLTVSKRKNRCIPCAYLGTAIFIVVIEYCNLFPSFTLFLNCFHFTFGYELIVCSKSTSFMKIICNGLAFICRNKSLFLNLDKIYCFQGI